MSNYTSENLIDVKPSQVPAGTLAVKIGEDVFTAGSVTVGEEVTAGYFAKDGDDLKFYPAGSQTGEVVSEIMIADTGKEEPQYEGGSGSSMNFYKCASVDTSNSTWSGHLVSISDSTGIWYFSSDSTSLTFDRLTPVVGSVYDEKCSFLVSDFQTTIPEDYLFYASGDSYTVANTEQEITSENISLVDDTSIRERVWSFSTDAYAYVPVPTFNYLNSAWTLSVWCNPSGMSGGYNGGHIFGLGGQSLLNVSEDNGNKTVYFAPCVSGSYGWEGLITYEMSWNSWHHILVTRESNDTRMYLDGAYVGSSNTPYVDTYFDGKLYFIRNQANQFYLAGRLAAMRLYNRVLSTSEISALANEFHPTAS